MIEVQGGTKPELLWLFEADFSDGTTYYQGTEDQSLNHEVGTAFTDVLDRMNEVVRFHVASIDGKHRATVDLTDGHFVIDGLSFELEGLPNQVIVPDPAKKPKLIYYMITSVQQDLNNRGEEVGRRHFVKRYILGWESTDKKGKEIKKTIAVSAV